MWHLAPRPSDRTMNGTMWVFQNKLDEFGITIRNKANLKRHYDHQHKNFKELLKRFEMENAKTIDTPITITSRMDEPCSPLNETMYRGIIGSLLYLTINKLDIVFGVGLCARFQSKPKRNSLKGRQKHFEVS